METNTPKPIPIIFDTYISMIKNSVGATMFRHYYALVDGKKVDIVQNGELACGFFVSFILHNFKLIGEPHLTVAGVEKALQTAGWKAITVHDLQEGCVLIWESRNFGDEQHKHLGFYIGDGHAISTGSQQGMVVEHAADFNGERKIGKAYWTEKLAH